MWVFLSDAYFSIVQDNNDHDRLLVRARFAHDIGRVFPDADTFEDNTADYRYRAFIPREVVARVLAEQVNKIDYGNFKGSVKDSERHRAYMDVWSVMARATRPLG